MLKHTVINFFVSLLYSAYHSNIWVLHNLNLFCWHHRKPVSVLLISYKGIRNAEIRGKEVILDATFERPWFLSFQCRSDLFCLCMQVFSTFHKAYLSNQSLGTQKMEKRAIKGSVWTVQFKSPYLSSSSVLLQLSPVRITKKESLLQAALSFAMPQFMFPE